MKLRTLNYSIGLLVILMAGCSQKKTASLFVPLTHEQTGLHFSNKVQPTPSFNLFSYMYFYNGAGVGAGDFNNDGLIDLFFAANQQPNALYLNTGKLNFKDVTAESKIPSDGNWSTGVSVVDINNDGLLDIYVCNVGNYKTLKGKNQLLVCQGITNGVPVYEDKAADYGLDFSGFSTQAAFLDYDADGDLDMFLLNHSVNHDGNYAPRGLFEHTYDSLAGQRLYRNDQQIGKDGKKRIGFSNVTKEAGINGSKIGYGLGVTVADINLDGWPDIYVGNDFHENDYLYINQQNGTFAEQGSKQLMHTSQFSMGVDVADVNNDAYPEIISMDMLPYDPYMLKRSLAEDDYNIFQQKLQYGYTYQYARNNLQYNRKNGMFSEVGQYAGVHATDWSWASLWMDFDNDGLKDLFVSNGIPKRMNDIDYVNYVSGDELQQKLKQNTIQDKDLSLISKFPEIKIPNQFFRNTGNLRFQNLTDSIQNNLPTFSNGSVYADLDNDGDLDLVVNNINDPVLVYENKTNTTGQEKNFVKVQLKGDSNNVNALGAKLLLYAKDQLYTYEQYPVHGFQSSMLLPLQAGLKNIQVDSALVIWPDRTWQPVQLANENMVKLSYKKGLPVFDFAQRFAKTGDTKQNLLEDITTTTGINYKHQENVFNEFDREPLIPHMVSTEGPALAVADINGDGLEDVFIGASKGNKNAVYTQTVSGNFTRMNQPALAADSMWEDVDAIWVDVNNDKAIDLVIATGGNEYYENDEHLRPLLYLNDGRGNLRKKENAFAEIVNTQSKVIANDINGDGFVDLFFAGRSVPWAYGMTPRSYLMLNDGYGNFRDITQAYAPALVQPGLITDAQWIDMDKDQQKDLLVAYQWGGIELFLKKQNSFERKMITTKKGWWQSIYADDIDQDGDIDLIAGNFGLNSRITASEKYPVRMYMNDFDDNGRVEQIMTYFVNGTEMPLSSKLQLEKSIPVLRKKYLYAADFAKAELKQLFAPQKFEKAYQLETNCFEHLLLLNEGELKFSAQALPQETQFSQLRSVIKVENNGSPYWLTMGNYYENNVEIGRQDADFSTLLQYVKGKGLVASNVKSALITGQVRKAKPILIRNSKAYILARNNDAVVVLQNRSTEKQGN